MNNKIIQQKQTLKLRGPTNYWDDQNLCICRQKLSLAEQLLEKKINGEMKY